jgi:SAM-dependent methyltransferase
MVPQGAEVLEVIRSRLRKLHIKDDYDWKAYPIEYSAQLSEISRQHTLKLAPGDYAFREGNLSRMMEVPPLHPNHRLLYETILQLRPESVMEIGCGGGDHLYNLMTLTPETKLYGCDISPQQLEFARTRSPNLSAALQTVDITNGVSVKILPKADLCFTQAVIMHIRSRSRYLHALRNLFTLAIKYVVLMENWSRHNFMLDIKSLWEVGNLPWTNVNFYYRIAPEYGRPHLMVVSTQPLKNYTVLSDYDVLLNPQTA